MTQNATSSSDGAGSADRRAWDGASYDRISGPMEAMGLAVLDRLELAGDELVLDAGCGSGRVTEALLQRLPRGRVIAVDLSPSMIEAARARLGADAELAAGSRLFGGRLGRGLLGGALHGPQIAVGGIVGRDLDPAGGGGGVDNGVLRK